MRILKVFFFFLLLSSLCNNLQKFCFNYRWNSIIQKMNCIIQKSGCANQTWIKLPAKLFAIFCIANYASKNLQKSTNMSSIGKNNPDFFLNFPMISLAKKKQKTKMVKFAITHSKCRLMIWKFGKPSLAQPLPYGPCEI